MENPFEIDFSAFGGPKNEEPDDLIEPEEAAGPVDANGIRAAKMIKTIPYHRMIRMISDKNIDDLLPWHFEDGVAYH